MCTSLTFATKDNIHFLARTMDFSFELDARPTYIPRGYKFETLESDKKYEAKYGFIGAGREVGRYLFADGVNEKGFAIASLYFEKNSKYNKEIKKDVLNIASTSMVTWALGNIASVSEFQKRCKEVNVVEAKSPIVNADVPLHWVVSDSTGNTGVLEMTESGTNFYEDKVGVMTNSPEFTWHLDNLSHYTNLQPMDFAPKKYGDFETVSDGPGSGALGLPGDYTSTSRFVRTAFLKEYSVKNEGAESGVTSILHILNAVDIPRGVKVTSRKTTDYTQYKGIMDLDNLSYYFMDYDETNLSKTDITPELLAKNEIVTF